MTPFFWVGTSGVAGLETKVVKTYYVFPSGGGIWNANIPPLGSFWKYENNRPTELLLISDGDSSLNAGKEEDNDDDGDGDDNGGEGEKMIRKVNIGDTIFVMTTGNTIFVMAITKKVVMMTTKFKTL